LLLDGGCRRRSRRALERARGDGGVERPEESEGAVATEWLLLQQGRLPSPGGGGQEGEGEGEGRGLVGVGGGKERALALDP
jgi:hypothetical protein